VCDGSVVLLRIKRLLLTTSPHPGYQAMALAMKGHFIFNPPQVVVMMMMMLRYHWYTVIPDQTVVTSYLMRQSTRLDRFKLSYMTRQSIRSDSFKVLHVPKPTIGPLGPVARLENGNGWKRLETHGNPPKNPTYCKVQRHFCL
jgi:hypothetical protein